jgi:hypothetical protein
MGGILRSGAGAEALVSNPPMTHLPGFWDPENWSDDKWAEYQRRHARRGAKVAERFDQALHQLMGRFMSRKKWKKREAKQWPSGTGAYDACVDEYHYLIGRGRTAKAKMLRAEARGRRPEFLG